MTDLILSPKHQADASFLKCKFTHNGPRLSRWIGMIHLFINHLYELYMKRLVFIKIQ